MSRTVVELPLSQRPMRVLTPDLSSRIHQVNAARALLAELGCSVREQRLHQGTKARPLLILDQVAPELQCRVKGLLRSLDQGRVEYRAHFGQVELAWSTGSVQ